MGANSNKIVDLFGKGSTLKDKFGREMKTLRLSVTDRCDLKCRYCMPEEGVSWLGKNELLTFEEKILAVETLVELGIDRIKITGGEPLLYSRLTELVERLSRLPLKDLSLTTNGTHLATLALPLKKAGLKRVTVSLDSTDEKRFKSITRGGSLKKVWNGLMAAEEAGLTPLKINCVVLKENQEDVVELARLTLEHPWEIRFIEYMPVTASVNLERSEGVPPREVKRTIEEVFGKLEPLSGYAHAPSADYRLPNAMGKIGFISSVSDSFCSRCDRLRLSADGFLKLCMAHADGLALKPLLQEGVPVEALKERIQGAVFHKPEGHSFWYTTPAPGEAMSRIGG
ncbi:MAG TPA: GTP 3',8-cyclase MoaA [bacterium]|nr:GTP 3',8-cyclase MoaA [bacterium]